MKKLPLSIDRIIVYKRSVWDFNIALTVLKFVLTLSKLSI